jgi:hypothetical protein
MQLHCIWTFWISVSVLATMTSSWVWAGTLLVKVDNFLFCNLDKICKISVIQIDLMQLHCIWTFWISVSVLATMTSSWVWAGTLLVKVDNFLFCNLDKICKISVIQINLLSQFVEVVNSNFMFVNMIVPYKVFSFCMNQKS